MNPTAQPRWPLTKCLSSRRPALAHFALLLCGVAFPILAQTTAPPHPSPATHPVGIVTEECFPLNSLSPEDRLVAERWLRDVLDKEALYTVASSLKPASLAFIAGRISVESPSPQEQSALAQAVRVLSVWRCGDLAATVLSGAVVVDGRRVLHGVLFRRNLIKQVVLTFPAVFAAAGIHPDLPAEQILATTELLPPPLRHRAWGHLLGYPPYAVDFFARADAQQRSATAPRPDSPRPLVPRDFFSIPTFAGETGHFVWAVPKGHQPTPEDLAIRTAAAPVLARYRELRASFLADGQPGVAALARALACPSGACPAPIAVPPTP